MIPLTPEESEFAAEHQELIIHFLSSRHLPEVDYYDIAVMGFLRAVKNWFSRPDLHRYAFSTIAWHAMSNRVWNSRRTDKLHPTFSLNNLISNTNITYMDLLPDRAMSIDDQICIRETIREAVGGEAADSMRGAIIWQT